MPQADLLSFRPTLAVLPVVFLVGYFFFVTHWVPRIQLTLRARAWLTPAGFPLQVDHPGWPEVFLGFVQFGGLLFFLSRVTLVPGAPPRGLVPLALPPPRPTTLAAQGGALVENVLLLWGTHRGGLFFAPAGACLTSLVGRLLGGFSFFVSPPQFSSLAVRLRGRLGRVSPPPGSTPGG